MKTVNYPLERLVQDASRKDGAALVDSFKAILESNKDYRRKADYIAYAITSIDTRVESIDEQLDHLTNLKKRLLSAKDVSLEAGAIAFDYYGVSKIGGSAFESVIVTKPINSNKQKLVITNRVALIEQGFFKYEKVLDSQRVLDEYIEGTYQVFLNQHTRLENVFKQQKSKLVVNKRVIEKNTHYKSLKVAS